ncbi:MAG: DUF2752 domain-containing protein [Muribaculaceae bacterium]|nr:DUF2752 domain-containing protein [Muribaculaceae bacterium]
MCAVLMVGVILFFIFIDPVQCTWAPKCIFKLLTGWQCPGCGFSRASHALLHGHISEALSYNYFFVISIPYALAVIISGFIPAGATGAWLKLRYWALHRYMAWFYIVTFCIWWVVRNILGI